MIAACFFVELGYAKPKALEVLKGLFVPQLKGSGATKLSISLLGAMFMPHNLFLHSALVLSKKIPRSVNGIEEACRFYLIESGIALVVAFLINVSIISAIGVPSFLRLLCWRLVRAGTYAGQYVMQGFLDLRLKPWIRNFLTRCLAIIPSLVVAIVGGSEGAGNLIVIASMILSFELPFAPIPLLKFSSSKAKMGLYANSRVVELVPLSINRDPIVCNQPISTEMYLCAIKYI